MDVHRKTSPAFTLFHETGIVLRLRDIVLHYGIRKIVQLHAMLTTSKPPVSSCNGKQPQALGVARWENMVFEGTMSDIPSLLLTFLLV